MNNLSRALALVLSLTLTISMTAFNFADFNDRKEAPVGVSFRIKNDTGSTVRLYDGRGYFSIGNSSSKRVSVDAGRKYYKGDKGRKGDFLFEVESGFSGKTIKLSNYY